MITFQVHHLFMACHCSDEEPIICGTQVSACAHYSQNCCYQCHFQFHRRLNLSFHCLLATLGYCNKVVFGMTCNLQQKEKNGIQMWKDRVQEEMHLVEANTSLAQMYLLAVVVAAAYDDLRWKGKKQDLACEECLGRKSEMALNEMLPLHMYKLMNSQLNQIE